MIIHLNGWLGAGKKTIGSVLAERIRARFIHNNLLHDVAIACTGVADPDRRRLYEQVRDAAYARLRRRPATEVFVMTNALCKNAPHEIEAWRHVVELAISRRIPLVPVVLEVAPEENSRRLQSQDRIGKKLRDPIELQSYFASDTLQYPAVPELLVLDTTHLSPEQSAAQIGAHADLIRLSLSAASNEHLIFR